jgi:hypothetical protein
MPETVLPDADVTTYYLDTIIAVADSYDDLNITLVDGLSMYLLDLMVLQEFRIVSGVSVSFPEPEGPVEYPEGFTVLRVSVDAQEMDVSI